MKSNHKLAIALVAGVAVGGQSSRGCTLNPHRLFTLSLTSTPSPTPKVSRRFPPNLGRRRWLLSAASTSYVLRKLPHSMELRPSGLLSSRLIARRKQKPGRLQQARRRLTRLGAKQRSRVSSLSRVCKD